MKSFWKRNHKLGYMFHVVSVSVASTLAVIAIVAGAMWHYRDRIISYVATHIQTPTGEPLAVIPSPVAPMIPEAPIAPVAPKDLTVTEVVAKGNPGVVSIEVSQVVPQVSVEEVFPGFYIPQSSAIKKPQVIGRGSGFFVSNDGLIVTNRHVVDAQNATTYTVITADGKKYPATVLDKDPVLDVAVLRVSGKNFPALKLGSSSNLELGQSVVAIGFALGQFKNSVSVGVISGLSRSIVAGDGSASESLDKVIQTDAAINPGNSGGPLLNLRGEVIGVNVAVAVGSQNIGFALPIDSVRTAIDSVRKTGVIVRPFIGIRYLQITPTVKSTYNLSVDYGLLVGPGSLGEPAVVPGSPADIAGITEGDIILSLDGIKLTEDVSFMNLIRQKSVGTRVKLIVLGSNKVERTLTVPLAKAPN